MSAIIYTVGHSTHSIEQFLDLLSRHSIEVIADVRSTPMSRHNPQYNRDALARALANVGIKYVFLGEELGARPKDRCCYIGNRADYDLIARTPAFQSGLNRLVQGSLKYRISLMCSEKEPLDCHRTILVSRHLQILGLHVRHLLADGRLEEHDQTMFRLVRTLGLPPPDMFHSMHDVLCDAYKLHGQAISYRENDAATPESRKAI